MHFLQESIFRASRETHSRHASLSVGRCDPTLSLRLSWAQIEIRRYGDALQTLNGIVYEQPNSQPDRAMVSAVAHWQAQEHDEAMRDFDGLGSRPDWDNPNWVKALYSPLVAQSVQEMKAEREQRKQGARVAASR